MEEDNETPQVKRDPVTGQLLKGSRLNPRGRPPAGKTFSDMVRDIRSKYGPKMIEALAQRAMDGNVQAFEALADRAEGRPKMSVDHSMSLGDQEMLEQMRLVLAERQSGALVVDAEVREIEEPSP